MIMFSCPVKIFREKHLATLSFSLLQGESSFDVDSVVMVGKTVFGLTLVLESLSDCQIELW